MVSCVSPWYRDRKIGDLKQALEVGASSVPSQVMYRPTY